MHARRRDLKKPLHVCFSRSATVHDAVLMDVGQELALSFGVGRLYTVLLEVNSHTINFCVNQTVSSATLTSMPSSPACRVNIRKSAVLLRIWSLFFSFLLACS
jgi:hypothetical protein